MTRRGFASERGFTLLEVLVALAILSASLGVLYEAFSIGARADRTAEFKARAAIFAQSLMATQGVSTPLAPGITNGDGPMKSKWELEVQEDGGNKLVQLYKLTLNIYDQGKVQYHLESLRIARADIN